STPKPDFCGHLLHSDLVSSVKHPKQCSALSTWLASPQQPAQSRNPPRSALLVPSIAGSVGAGPTAPKPELAKQPERRLRLVSLAALARRLPMLAEHRPQEWAFLPPWQQSFDPAQRHTDVPCPAASQPKPGRLKVKSFA